MNYDIEVAWQINDFCNFDCPYCWLHNRDKRNIFKGLDDTQKVVDGFNKIGLTWLVHMSGGEPFFFPNFIELCRELTKKHFISINTNLSHKDLFSFAESIDPERVDFIHCSLHIEERKRFKAIEDFIEKYEYLKKRGFCIFASYLMYPKHINRFKVDYEFFKSKGIILHPKVFWGYYYGAFGVFGSKFLEEFNTFTKIKKFLNMNYPNAYSKSQKELIRLYIEKSHRDDIDQQRLTQRRTVELYLDKNWIDKLPSFKGKYCLAGDKFVKMDHSGEVFRCQDESRGRLGNLFTSEIKLFTGPKICETEICSCPYVGYRYTMQFN